MSDIEDSVDLNKLTNGELFNICITKGYTIRSAATRDQMIKIISSHQKPKKKVKHLKPPDSTPRQVKYANPSLITPKAVDATPGQLPTPIVSSNNENYQRMWDRRYEKMKEKQSAEADSSRVSSPTIGEAARIGSSPTEKLNTSYNNSNKEICKTVSIIAAVISFVYVFFIMDI